MSTTVKSGSQSRKRKFHLRRRFTHEDRRRIAKLLVAGMTPKQVQIDFGVSHPTITKIKQAYVIVTLAERYPDVPEQESLPLPHTPQRSP